MKIVHLLTYYGDYIGGIQIYVKELAKRQKALGNNVKIITSSLYGKEKEVEGIKVIKSPVLFSAFRIPFTPILPYHLFIEKIDVLHVHLPSPWIDLCSVLKKIISPNTKLVITIHNYLPFADTFPKKIFSFVHDKIFIKLALKFADEVTTCSEGFAKSLPYKINDKKLNIIPYGLDLNKFKSLNLKKKNQILFVGRLIPEKGLLELVKAVKSIPKLKRLRVLAIVSETYKYSKYKEECLKEGKDFLEIKANVPNEGIINYYNESKVFVFPSLGIDSFGIVLIEAMACGLPVVCTNLPGPSSIVPSYAGVIVNPKNKKELMKAIEKVLNGNYDSNQIEEYVKENFDYETITKKILEVYKT